MVPEEPIKHKINTTIKLNTGYPQKQDPLFNAKGNFRDCNLLFASKSLKRVNKKKNKTNQETLNFSVKKYI